MDEVVLYILAAPVVLFLMLILLTIIFDSLTYGIAYCSSNSCGPLAYLWLQFLATVLQILHLPIYLTLVVLEQVLAVFVLVLSFAATTLILVLGQPLALITLAIVLINCVYWRPYIEGNYIEGEEV